MRKILLVNPLCKPVAPRTKLSSRSITVKWLPFEGAIPLSLATIAALTPDDVEVDIWDEAVDGTITLRTDFKKAYTLVGVTGYINHATRVKALGQIFRQRGILTAVGGSGVSSEPELFRDSFDIRFIGEAEYTWPQFISDWKAGSFRSEYRQVSKVDMAHSPLPKWDKLSLRSYFMGAVQTTRGCPFDCEFCDVIYIFGRQVRHKAIDQVLEEVSALERRGLRRVLFCDDNFIGNPHYAKDLVRELKHLNQSFRRPVSFYTQISLNVARDDEMLELMADVNFPGLFIGIESPNIKSLIETNKSQNYKTDIAAAVKKIQSYGIAVQSGMIVGFDNDDATIFDRHFEFLQETGLTIPMINVLKAPKGTPLWVRLLKEGRVIKLPESRQIASTESLTNVVPKQMTLGELLSGYIALVERVREWSNFEARVRTMISQIKRRPNRKARRYWNEALKYLLPVSLMDGEARWVTLRLLWHTWRRAPFMIETVMGICSIQYLEAFRIPLLKESVGERIRQFTENGMHWEREEIVFLVPGEFKKPYKAVFPELFERIYLGLVDKSRTHDALIEVTCNFLTRWGSGFQRFEAHHRVFLEELCDRTIAAENRRLHPTAGQNPDSAGLPGESGNPDRRREVLLRGLSDEVLRCVEQELRSF